MSSLILQGMDGVDADYILKINSKVIKPDLQVAVSADESRLQERLSERQMLSRFEKGNQSEKELFYMKQGIKMLLHEKVQILEVCNNNDVEEEVRQITSYVEKIWRNH